MAVDMFLKIGDLKGESKDKSHKDEIDVLSWNWGMRQNGTAHSGGGAGSGKVSIQDLSFTKLVDRCSPNLMMMCSSGKPFPEAMLTIRKAGDNPLEYLTIKLKNVIIGSVATGASTGQEQITENVTLNFAKVELAYQPQKDDGSKEGGPVKYGWDIPANVKI